MPVPHHNPPRTTGDIASVASPPAGCHARHHAVARPPKRRPNRSAQSGRRCPAKASTTADSLERPASGCLAAGLAATCRIGTCCSCRQRVVVGDTLPARPDGRSRRRRPGGLAVPQRQQSFQFLPGSHGQGVRSRRRKGRGREGQSQPHQPQARRQEAQVTFEGLPDLPLDQAACDRSLGMPFRHHVTEPQAPGRLVHR